MDDFKNRVTFAATVARPMATPELPIGALPDQLPTAPGGPPVEVNAATPIPPAEPVEANAPPAVSVPAAPPTQDAQPEEVAVSPDVNEPAETPPSSRR